MNRNLLAALLSVIVLLTFPPRAPADEGAKPAGAARKEFRAGAAASNVTPPLGVSINGGMNDRKATRVHDELHARCLVLDDGRTKLAVVVVDSCALPRSVTDEAKRLARERTGIPPDNILASATHTHSAPTAAAIFQSEPDEAYQKFLSARIADGIAKAADNLAPAQVGWGVGREPGQVFNRRWKMKPGTIPADPFGGKTDRVKMNPPVGSPDLLEPAGPTDPEVSVLSVRTPEGEPIALLANYSLHYVGDVPGSEISADYFGAFAEAVRRRLGAEGREPPFVGILSNGTSGDVNNVNFRGGQPKQPPFGQIKLVAGVVADEAFRVYGGIEHKDWVELGARTARAEFAVRKPSAEDVGRAKARLKARGPVALTVEEVYAHETVRLADYPDKVELVLQALRIGDVGIAAIPCETFVEIGLEIKAKSPLKPAFTISLANGYNGYLPTPEHHQLGGYETWRARSSYLEVGASPKVTETVLRLLNELKQP